MLRCVTEDNQSLIATYCEETSTRTLSRTDKLFAQIVEVLLPSIREK